jgi:hypothetical protein
MMYRHGFPGPISAWPACAIYPAAGLPDTPKTRLIPFLPDVQAALAEEWPTGCAHGLRARILTDQKDRELMIEGISLRSILRQLSLVLILFDPCMQSVYEVRGPFFFVPRR